MEDLTLWLLTRAKELRKEQTSQEEKLWRALRAKRFCDFKFRRQEVIARYVVDFVCFQKKLIIELDGSQHLDQKDYDGNRDAWLQEQGYQILRFWKNEVDHQFESVLERIYQELT